MEEEIEYKKTAHNCGNCIYHVPNPKMTSSKIVHNSNLCVWMCMLTKKDKMWDQGGACNDFENRYENGGREGEWLKNIYRDKEDEKQTIKAQRV